MKTNKKFLQILSVLVAAVMLLSVALVLTGCGDEDKKDDKKATTAPTAAATAAPTAAPTIAENTTAGGNSSDADNQQSTYAQSGDDQPQYDADEKHGNITQEEAAQIALQNCEYGQVVTIADPADYDGQDCWHVVVQDTAGRYYDCYVSSIFCEVTRAPVEDHDYGYDDDDYDDYDDDDDYDYDYDDGGEEVNDAE